MYNNNGINVAAIIGAVLPAFYVKLNSLDYIYVIISSMKRIALFLVLLASTLSGNGQTLYSRAKIYLDGHGRTLRDLAATGVAVDHGEYKKDSYFISDFSEWELNQAKQKGYKVETLIEDVSRYYAEQNNKKTAAKATTAADCNIGPLPETPSHFHLGNYGGYFTYTELLSILDSMRLLYPALISAYQPIDTFHTIEGRPIYWLRVSNNPSVNQPGKPQMLVTSLHHAREPGSISSNVFYLWYLLEHYSTDARIKTIIDNTELYFIPCLNPDGYLFNIAGYPGGGGMWRKNRRDNGDGTYGVDLNRNYGYSFGYDDVGSSPTTMSETYRGAAGFSEPETRAIKWFTEQHRFKITLNYHTYNNDLLYPWGYIPSYQTLDSTQFQAYGSFLTKDNHYRYGTCDQTLNYITNGDSNDWMYGDVTAKPKVFAFTPEIGDNQFGFYTPIENIIPDCQRNLQSNIDAASLLLPFARIQSMDQKILVTANGYLHYTLQRLGFPDTGTYTVSVLPLDAWLTVSSATKVYTGLSMAAVVSDSISYTIAPGAPNGQLIKYVLQVYNGHYYTRDTVQFYYGKRYNITTESTNTLTDWTNAGWGVCTTGYYSAPSCLITSASGRPPYEDANTVSITTVRPIDLTYSTKAYLNFFAKWGIESHLDYVAVMASVSGSGVWSALCGKYTKPGSLYQLYEQPIYDGQQPAWVQEQMDLSVYLGQRVDIRFLLAADNNITYDGFYLDDLQVRSVQDTPSFLAPVSASGAAMRIYPNPATDELQIYVDGIDFSRPLQAKLYDALGREVSSLMISSPRQAMDIVNLPSGVYYLKVVQGIESLPVQKVVIR